MLHLLQDTGTFAQIPGLPPLAKLRTAEVHEPDVDGEDGRTAPNDPDLPKVLN